MHIILYVLDALRADHLGCYGYARDTSPNIDAIAKDGILFENCYTATTWTRPVAASLLTGVYPAVHQTRNRSEMFATSLLRLPALLGQAGFKTAGFTTMGNIAGNIGFNRGFDQYIDIYKSPEILRKRQRLDPVAAAMVHAQGEEIVLPLAEDINPYLLNWLDENSANDTFSFVWSIQPHVPYNAPPKYRKFSPKMLSRSNEGQQDDIRGANEGDRARLINLYDDEIVYNDACLGRIVNHLKTKKLYDDTAIFIIGDHGEAFYEHGVYFHGHAPYEEVVHVPLIVKLPKGVHAGARVKGLAALVDLLPTIAEVAKVELPADNRVQGKNLLPLAAGKTGSVRQYVFSDTQALDIHNRYLSVRDAQYKYIRVDRPKRDGRTLLTTIKHVFERGLLFHILLKPRHFLRTYFRRENELLFDLVADPFEQINLLRQQPAEANRLRLILDEWMQENERLAAGVSSLEDDISYEENEMLRQHLKELGYIE